MQPLDLTGTVRVSLSLLQPSRPKSSRSGKLLTSNSQGTAVLYGSLWAGFQQTQKTFHLRFPDNRAYRFQLFILQETSYGDGKAKSIIGTNKDARLIVAKAYWPRLHRRVVRRQLSECALFHCLNLRDVCARICGLPDNGEPIQQVIVRLNGVKKQML